MFVPGDLSRFGSGQIPIMRSLTTHKWKRSIRGNGCYSSIRQNSWHIMTWRDRRVLQLLHHHEHGLNNTCAMAGSLPLSSRPIPNTLQYGKAFTKQKQIWFINTLRPRQHGRHFPDDIFKCSFLNENVSIAIKISMTFLPTIPNNNNPSLIQIMARRRSGDKPLSGTIVISWLSHISVTRP